jgi:SAM-dependent methyltransferase
MNEVSQKKIWDHFQRACPQVFKDAAPRLDYLADRVLKKSKGAHTRVLNIGVGSGYLETRIEQMGLDIHTLDPDELTLKTLSEKGVKTCCGYVEKMPFDSRVFDFVIASEVLEHLNDFQLKQGLREIRRIMVKGAWLFGTVPYNEDLQLNQAVCPACGHCFHRWGHARSFDDHSLRQTLKMRFDDIDIKKTAFVNFWDRGWRGFIKSCVRRILARYGSPIAVPSLFFSGRKG